MNRTLRHYTLSLFRLLLVIGFIHDPAAAQTISADSLWNNALQAYRNRDYTGALAMMRQPVLRSAPALASAAQYYEGQLLFETEQYPQARTALEHFLANDPAHA